MKLTKKYYMFRMNDGGLPVLTEHDTLEECHDELAKVIFQHWCIVLREVRKVVEESND